MERSISFGEWLRRRRKAMDLTQEGLAQRVGCSVVTIRKIESEERRPSRQIAELLAKQTEIPQDQRELFIKIARSQSMAGQLPALTERTWKLQGERRNLSNKRLPALATRLIGREYELASILDLLQEPECRLLTLMGPPGIGKTHLALQAAHEINAMREARYADGVFFAALGTINQVEAIAPAISEVIGMVLARSEGLREALIEILADKRMLLVVDNLEHLIDGADLFSEILRHAAGITILVTSCERLNIQGEWLFEVQGLPVPAADQTTNLESNAAVALFLRSAKRMKLDFDPSIEELRAIARICRQAAGMPLGIVLAAAWVRTLTCEEIAREMESKSLDGVGQDFLTVSSRDLPERHRSMRAVSGYLWSLLSESERQAIQRLSIFPGSFSRAEAEQTAGVSLASLAALKDKSLVMRDEKGGYHLQEFVRQYAELSISKTPDERSKIFDEHSPCEFAWLDKQAASNG